MHETNQENLSIIFAKTYLLNLFWSEKLLFNLVVLTSLIASKLLLELYLLRSLADFLRNSDILWHFVKELLTDCPVVERSGTEPDEFLVIFLSEGDLFMFVEPDGFGNDERPWYRIAEIGLWGTSFVIFGVDWACGFRDAGH